MWHQSTPACLSDQSEFLLLRARHPAYPVPTALLLEPCSGRTKVCPESGDKPGAGGAREFGPNRSDSARISSRIGACCTALAGGSYWWRLIGAGRSRRKSARGHQRQLPRPRKHSFSSKSAHCRPDSGRVSEPPDSGHLAGPKRSPGRPPLELPLGCHAQHNC